MSGLWVYASLTRRRDRARARRQGPHDGDSGEGPFPPTPPARCGVRPQQERRPLVRSRRAHD